MHPVDELFAVMDEVERYPDGVMKVPHRIPGLAFFPGGAGLWGAQADKPLPQMPRRGVMILGHDFHSEEAHWQSYHAGREDHARGPTWRGLLPLLRCAGIAEASCFFTNAYMGLRTGAQATGRFPGSRDAGYVDRCQRYFGRQVAAQEPRLVLTLGNNVPRFLAPIAPRLKPWTNAVTFADIDRAGPLHTDVQVRGLSAPPFVVAALTHPCMRSSNVRHRRYSGLAGNDAERRLLGEAVTSADVQVTPQ